MNVTNESFQVLVLITFDTCQAEVRLNIVNSLLSTVYLYSKTINVFFLSGQVLECMFAKNAQVPT